MKQLKNPSVSAVVFAIGGLAAMALRYWLLKAGLDDRGLLISSHLGSVLSYVLCLGLPIAFLALLWKEKPTLQFSATPLSAVGFFALAAGLGFAGWKLLSVTVLTMHLATGIFGIAGALCAAVAGVYALKGYKTHPLFFSPGVLFFACFLYCRYQQWSGEPELQRYVFQLLSAVLSMIALYQRSALAVKIGNGKRYLLWSRSAVLMCLAAIPGSQLPLLWIAMAVFFALDGCEAADQ